MTVTQDTLAQELEAIDARLRQMPMPFDLHPAVNDLLRVWEKAGASIIEALRADAPLEDAVEEADTETLMRRHSKPWRTLVYCGEPDNRDAKEYHQLWVHAVAHADTWRGIAAAMGYEAGAHHAVKPKAAWLIDRIGKYRAALRAQPSPEQTEPSATHSETLREALGSAHETLCRIHQTNECADTRSTALQECASIAAALAKLDQPLNGRAGCEHKWRYDGTDYHGSHKGEDSYSCVKCHAHEYRP